MTGVLLRRECSRLRLRWSPSRTAELNYIKLINWRLLSEHKGSPSEYRAGLKLAIKRGWLWKHESGTYVKLTQSGADLFV